MKKMALVFAVFFAFQVFALIEGNYTYTVSNGKATITDFPESVSGAIEIPSTFGGYPVTIIGSSAFFNCRSLTSVVIPEGVTSIGSLAFYYCRSLTSVVIPESVTSIENGAFYGCNSLTSVVIPESVTSIGSDAFYDCQLVILKCDVPSDYKNINGNAILLPKKYAANWKKVLSRWETYEEIVNYAKVDVMAEMVTPKTTKVTYKVIDAKGEKVKTRAVAFKDGVRSFANIVPVRSGENVPNGSEVEADVEHSFIWNVPEDWDIDLAKVKVEILVQEGQLLPQELVTIPANGENKEMTITVNEIPQSMSYNALLWCYAEGDEALKVTDGDVYVNNTRIIDSYYDRYEERYYRQTIWMNYLYGKLGFKVLAGNDLDYAEKMTRLDFIGNERNYSSSDSELLRQVSVKIEE